MARAIAMPPIRLSVWGCVNYKRLKDSVIKVAIPTSSENKDFGVVLRAGINYTNSKGPTL